MTSTNSSTTQPEPTPEQMAEADENYTLNSEGQAVFVSVVSDDDDDFDPNDDAGEFEDDEDFDDDDEYDEDFEDELPPF